MKNMKLRCFLYMALAALALGSCSDWTDTEREVFPEQEEIQRIIPFLEAQTEEDLMPSERAYYRKLREEYRPSPHVKGFGWFGNWTGKGTNEQNYLKCLPDSVDFVSLWGARGNLSPEQKADLKFFQDIKGGKALLCWIIQDIGSAITPEGENMHTYWLEKAGGNEVEASKLYANAIADTIVKYNLDGFDIDYEPGYGHSGTLADGRKISDNPDHNRKMYWFIKTLYDRFQAHEQETGKDMLLVMDGEPYKCTTETSEMIDHYIYQAYWEMSTSSVIYKIQNEHLSEWERKTIITVEFEQGWRTGGLTYYNSIRPELKGMEGRQILDYATLDLPSGLRIGGIGTYHMEYDYKNNPPYKWLRMALYYGNQKFPGKYQ